MNPEKPRITRVKYRLPTKNTHEWRPYHQLWCIYHSLALDVCMMHDGPRNTAIDPFARNCSWAFPFTNDINIDTEAEDHLDAEDYLDVVEQHQGRNSFGIGLLDPPFSERMNKKLYSDGQLGDGSPNLYASDSAKMKRIQFKLGNLIAAGGYLIKAGYNSNRPHPGFDLVEMRIVALGASRNDVIFTVWKKNQRTLDDVWEME